MRMLKAAAVLLLATFAVSAEDSPMVALAKRANRKASKTPVITNDTVAASRGRFSQPTGEAPVQPPTRPTTATASTIATTVTPPAPARPPEVATVPAPRPQQPVALPGQVGSGAFAPSTARNIEPQSTARNITPAATTVSTIQPQSSARTIQTTSGQPITPQSTARNIQPQAVPVQGVKKQ